MSRLKEILSKKAKRKARLMSSLDSILEQLKSIGVLKIVLFGSLAYDEVDVYSDLDILAIMPSTRSGRQWMTLIYDEVERGIASDIIVFNEREFEENVAASSFLQNIVNSGKVVYEKTV